MIIWMWMWMPIPKIPKESKPNILTTGNLLPGNTYDDNNNLNGENGSGSVDNYENWKRLRVLKGHSLDVVGLAWSPNDMFLVSCSLDSEAPICVWKPNVIVNPQQEDDYNYTSRNNSVVPTVIRPFKIIGQKEHTSTVKGITFDPAG